MSNNNMKEGARQWCREEVDAEMLLQTNKYELYRNCVSSLMGDLVTWDKSQRDAWILHGQRDFGFTSRSTNVSVC